MEVEHDAGAQRPEREVESGAAAAESEPEREPRPFVVGIGASAGGLEATLALLRELPADTGMAFVVVMHLDPTYPSQLAEILGRATRMPVRLANQDTDVEPDTVYVIAPGRSLEMEGGRLRVTPSPESRAQHRPIDRFLRTLAEDRGSRSIGVILSGNASDGTLGVEEVKAAGGITFAQDQTAEHASMPRSAAAAGFIDFVLPPAEIARELARLSRHPLAAAGALPGGVWPREAELLEVLHVVRHATGGDFTHYKRSTLLRRIARRMMLHRVEDMREYAKLLESDPKEAEALYQDVLIGVTSFFRNPESFDALKTLVFPRLVNDRPRNEPVRVWVMGCSTGQEAYSLAIAFTEFVESSGRRVPLQLFASDLNGVAVERARAGTYARSHVQELSPERLRRHFTEVEGGYRIAKSIRDQCVFARQDLVTDPPFSRIDLIACRNTLIYLDSVLQQRLLPVCHYALKPEGWLWLGTSETIGGFRDLFEIVDPKHKIYARKPGRTQGLAHASPRRASSFELPAHASARDAEPAPGADVRAEADKLLLARYAPPSVVLTDDLEIVQFRGDAGPYLAPSPGRASLNLLRMLREGLIVGVRRAITRAREEGVPVREEGLSVKTVGGFREVDVQVVPFRGGSGGRASFLLSFEEPAQAFAARLRQTEAELVKAAAPRPGREGETRDQELARIRQELQATKEYLQSVIEQKEAANEELQSANEEIQSGNEELQSINEELETSKEEIQSSNEELVTVNDELQNRNLELNQSNNDLLNLLSSVQVAIVMLGSDLRIRRFTPAAEKLLKLGATDVGRPIDIVRAEFRLHDLDQLLVRVIDTVSVHEVEVQDRNGRWYFLSLRPYRTRENKIEGAVLVLVDIDTVKRGKALQDQQAELLDQTHAPILMWQRGGSITYWNRGAEETYGYPRAEAVGQSPWELLRTTPPKHVIEQGLAQSGRWSGELTRVSKSGATIVVESRMTVASGAGGAEMVLETEHPITERKRAEQALKMKAEELGARTAELTVADRNKNEFLALLAHELRNPLSSMRSATHILRLSPDDDQMVANALSILERQSAHMSSMVDDLLDVSRITRGEVRLRKRPLDLGALVASVVESSRRRCTKDLHYSVEPPARPVFVEGDPVRLEQIFGNLLSNACKFSDHGRNVVVAVRRAAVEMGQEAGVVVTVRDEGVGIEPGSLERIFDMFVQAERTIGRTTEGMGIGLSLARNLCRLHGGDIEARSEGIGRGCEFVVTLPALPEERPVLPAEPRAEAPVEPRRVLVVDDNVDAASMLSALLTLLGHEVRVENGGLDALRAAAEFRPNVIVLDLGMPGMDGFEVARRLRAQPENAGLLLVALTGYSQDHHVEAARAAGFDRHLTKPVDLEKLKKALGGSRTPAG